MNSLAVEVDVVAVEFGMPSHRFIEIDGRNFLGSHYFPCKRVAGRWRAHRGFMLAAFVTSTLFLLCYLTSHGYLAYVLHRGPTRFLEPAWFRPIYLLVLLTHTLLAVVIVPIRLLKNSKNF